MSEYIEELWDEDLYGKRPQPRTPWLHRVAAWGAAGFTLAGVGLGLGASYAVVPVAGDSMSPAFQDGDSLVMRTVLVGGVGHGDVVVFPTPSAWGLEAPTVVKRVVAVPGDAFELSAAGMVTVNGQELDEPYVASRPMFSTPVKFTLPDDCLYVLGDNRWVSFGSTSVEVDEDGCVPLSSVRGVVVGTLPF